MLHSESLLVREHGKSKETVRSVDGFCADHLRSSFGIGVDCHIGTICHGQSQEAVFIILLQQTHVFLLLLAQSVFHYLQVNRWLPCMVSDSCQSCRGLSRKTMASAAAFLHGISTHCGLPYVGSMNHRNHDISTDERTYCLWYHK